MIPCFLGPLIGILGDRYGPKWLATGGFFLAVPFLVCLMLVTENSMGHKIMLCGLLVGVGTAIAFVFGPLMAEITWSVTGDGADAETLSTAPFAQAYGLYNVAFSGGIMVGPLIGGLIRDSAGWTTVCWVLGLIAGVTALTQFLLEIFQELAKLPNLVIVVSAGNEIEEVEVSKVSLWELNIMFYVHGLDTYVDIRMNRQKRSLTPSNLQLWHL